MLEERRAGRVGGLMAENGGGEGLGIERTLNGGEAAPPPKCLYRSTIRGTAETRVKLKSVFTWLAGLE
jgi:hypothetical protein